MFEDRSLKLDVFALVLFALVVFLTVALGSYDKLDPPSTLADPPADQIHNACGRLGAFAAHGLLQLLGVGAYFLTFSLGVFDLWLLVRRPIDQPVLRSIGWFMSLAGICTLAAIILPETSPGPVIGPGGYVGAAGRGLLEINFASAGAVIFTLSVLMAGLLLSTDYVLLRFTAQTVGVSSRGLARVGLTLSPKPGNAAKTAPEKLRGKKAEKTTDKKAAQEIANEDDDAEEPAIRIRGKGEKPEAAEAKDAEEQETTDEAEETAEEEEVAAKPAEGMRKRVADALRIRKPKCKPVEAERDEVMKELDAASQDDEPIDYTLPPIDLLLEGETVSFEDHEKEVRQKAKILEKTFANFGFKVKVVEIETGPVIAQYEVELEAGLRLSKITGLSDDLAIALRVPSVRIVAPIPGKNTVGIEVPNENRQLVRLREVIEEMNGRAKRFKIPIFLGKDVSGKPMVVDLAAMPHLLIAGRTGTGKSVCLNSIIISMLMTRRPDEVRMLMIDPKMVELSPYKKLPHLMHPVVTDMRKAEAILAWAVEKMEERYALLARAGVRHVTVYNQLGEEELMDRLQPETDEERKNIPTNLPFIVVVADEIADLMMTSGKEVEQHIIRLAQKSRAVGIHLILATQKPTVDVITGLIKSNLPARIAFQVSSRTDSRVVLDEMGADKLLGNGDMLFLQPGTSMLLRGQGTYLSDDEINRVIDFVGTTEPQFVKELVQLKAKDAGDGKAGEALKNRDELYESAVDLVVREGRGSVSLLQRALGIGYGRAARLIDFMAEDGYVGEYNGSQAREVLLTVEQWEEMTGNSGGGDGSGGSGDAVTALDAKPPKRSNKIVPQHDEEDDDSDADDEYESDMSDDEEGDSKTPFGDEDEEEELTDSDEEEDEEDESDEEEVEDDEADEEAESDEIDDELDQDEQSDADGEASRSRRASTPRRNRAG